jgi:hypothetical protein
MQVGPFQWSRRTLDPIHPTSEAIARTGTVARAILSAGDTQGGSIAMTGWTGDQQAGDGIYSFSLLVSSEALSGFYTFTFYARDKAANLSAAQVRVIEIVEGN